MAVRRPGAAFFEFTEGVDVLSWKRPEGENGEAANVRVWDFAGHVVTHSAHRYFLTAHPEIPQTMLSWFGR